MTSSVALKLQDGWTRSLLSDVAEFQNGHAFYVQGYSKVGLLAFDLFNIDEEGRIRVGERDKFVAQEVAAKYSKFVLNKNDLVIVMTDMTQRLGILGKCCIIDQDEKYILNQRMGRIVANKKIILPRYLRYFINSEHFLRPLHALVKGTVQKYVNTGDIKGNYVSFPPLPVQERVVSVLSGYDDLIENNIRRINTLEQMALMLYREWFVNFCFPGHEKVRMMKSNRGNTPEGWACVPCTEAIEIDPAMRVPREDLKPFVPMGSLSPTSMLISDIEEREGNAGSKFRNGDTLFARITPCLENGKTGFVQFLPTADAVAFGSTEFIVLRSRTVCPEYVYLMARSDEFRDNAIKSMSGATGRQRVQQGCFEKFFIAQPPAVLLRDFQTVVSPMFRLIYTLSLKNANLRKTRDLLLPKLVSGEISVEQLESEAIAQNA